MTSRHLGKRIYELVDGHLSREDAAAAMGHLNECSVCQAKWDDLRHDREAIQTSGTGIDMTFARHLLDRDRIATIAKDEPRRHAKAARGTGVNVRVIVVASAASMVAILGVLWMLGAPQEVRLEFADMSQRTDALNVEYIAAPAMRSETALVAWVHPDWKISQVIPVSANVVHTADGRIVLVATILAALDQITVTEQHGRLPSHMDYSYPTAMVNGQSFYLVSAEPAQMVWQTGDVVIGLACDCSMETLEDVAMEFPDAEDPGFLGRIGSGMEVLTDALAGD